MGLPYSNLDVRHISTTGEMPVYSHFDWIISTRQTDMANFPFCYEIVPLLDGLRSFLLLRDLYSSMRLFVEFWH